MGWINVRATNIFLSDRRPVSVMGDYCLNPQDGSYSTVKLTSNEIPKMISAWLYEDSVIMVESWDNPITYRYALRSDVSDPLFWSQPFTTDWIEDLGEQLK